MNRRGGNLVDAYTPKADAPLAIELEQLRIHLAVVAQPRLIAHLAQKLVLLRTRHSGEIVARLRLHANEILASALVERRLGGELCPRNLAVPGDELPLPEILLIENDRTRQPQLRVKRLIERFIEFR